uniref:Uncharacterized protein n=1 Tax=Plectus sambesii TaxID=2011161 RepID=A0A914XAF2_9BILA
MDNLSMDTFGRVLQLTRRTPRSRTPDYFSWIKYQVLHKCVRSLVDSYLFKVRLIHFAKSKVVGRTEVNQCPVQKANVDACVAYFISRMGTVTNVRFDTDERLNCPSLLNAENVAITRLSYSPRAKAVKMLNSLIAKHSPTLRYLRNLNGDGILAITGQLRAKYLMLFIAPRFDREGGLKRLADEKIGAALVQLAASGAKAKRLSIRMDNLVSDETIRNVIVSLEVERLRWQWQEYGEFERMRKSSIGWLRRSIDANLSFPNITHLFLTLSGGANTVQEIVNIPGQIKQVFPGLVKLDIVRSWQFNYQDVLNLVCQFFADLPHLRVMLKLSARFDPNTYIRPVKKISIDELLALFLTAIPDLRSASLERNRFGHRIIHVVSMSGKCEAEVIMDS